MTPLSDIDRALIARMCGDIGEGLHPFREIAEELGLSEEEVLERLRSYRQAGVMRRFGAILRHQRAGFTANGMSVWDVPHPDLPRVAKIISAHREVSHCYERPRLPDWPYSLYAMIHAHTQQECESIAAQIARETGITDYRILFSVREFKKTSMEYYR